MTKQAVRTHIVLPRDLVEAIDRIVGARRRSRFVEEAIAEKLARERQEEALRESAGALDSTEYPDWNTPEKISAWVRNLRRQADEATSRKLRGRRTT
ncbi:MAG: CopG family ribbon-helix-helix protein [Dehalococcoidia bacterium]